MAERNLCVAAIRVVRLATSLATVIGESDMLSRLKIAISTLLPVLLYVEEISYHQNYAESWLCHLRKTLDDAENLLESFIYESSGRRSRRKPSLESETMMVMILGVTETIERFTKEEIWTSFEFSQNERRERDIRVVEEKDLVKELVSEDSYFGDGAGFSTRFGGNLLPFYERLNDTSKMDCDVLFTVSGHVREKASEVLGFKFKGSKSQVRIWASPSGVNLDKAVLVSSLSETITKIENCSFDNLEFLLEEKLLTEKECLIVVDNMTRDIHRLCDFLLREKWGARGSRAIIVTCDLMIGLVNKSFYLERASVEETRDLFKKMAFGGREAKEWHGEVVRNCESLHVVLIMAIAGTLYFEESEEESSDFIQKVTLIIQKSPRPFTYHSGPSLCHSAILQLCYDRLPSNLKHCFAYCSLFPRYHEFDVKKLVRLWIAQGFVDDDDEDLGYNYFLNLLRRFFFYEAKVDARGRVTSCLMHSSMHELSTFAAGIRCRFITTQRPIPSTISHFSFGSENVLSEELYNQESFSLVRSILFPTRKGHNNEQAQDWQELVSKSKSIRALEICGLASTSALQSIGKLRHLTYLDLSHNKNLNKLPNSITKLQNLQTLRLTCCLKLRELPKDFVKLVNLKHLEMDGRYIVAGLPRGFGQLANLRTLSEVVLTNNGTTSSHEVNELKQLHNLSELRIKNLRHGMHDFLDGIRKIHSLFIEWEFRAPRPEVNIKRLKIDQHRYIEELSLSGCRNLNSLTCFPENLKKLSLKRCLGCQVLPPLDMCNNLKLLVLDDMPDLEYVSEKFTEEISLSLQEVWLTELRELKGWSKTNSQDVSFFARLLKLVIEDCPKFDSIPLFPTLSEGLVMDSTSWKPFEQTMNLKLTPSLSTSPLSKLKSLCIVAIENFDNEKASQISWSSLKSVELLKLDFLPKLEFLPDGLRQVKSLKELHIWRCGVKELPDWIIFFRFLKKLVIRLCPNLEMLPDKMKYFSLKTLEIEDCPTLLRRCEKNIGVDWFKIAHIKDIRLGQIPNTR